MGRVLKIVAGRAGRVVHRVNRPPCLITVRRLRPVDHRLAVVPLMVAVPHAENPVVALSYVAVIDSETTTGWRSKGSESRIPAELLARVAVVATAWPHDQVRPFALVAGTDRQTVTGRVIVQSKGAGWRRRGRAAGDNG